MGVQVQEQLCFEQEPEATVLLGGCDHSRAVSEIEVYSPNGLSAVIPESPLNSCTKPSSVYHKQSIVLCGGGDANVSTPCFSHKLGTATWESMPSLNEHRERFTMNVVGDKIAVIGGFKSGTDVEVFDQGAWKPGPDLTANHGLVHHCSVSYGNNKVMVIGGMIDGNTTDVVQTIDFMTGKVSLVSSLLKHRYAHACSKANFAGEEYIVVAGGFETYSVCNSVEYISACEGNDGKKHIWNSLAPMNIRRYDFGLSMYGNQLAAFGGEPTIRSEELEVFNFAEKKWKLTGTKINDADRHYFTAISIPESDFPEEITTMKTITSTSTITVNETNNTEVTTNAVTDITMSETDIITVTETDSSEVTSETTYAVTNKVTTELPEKEVTEGEVTTTADVLTEITTEAVDSSTIITDLPLSTVVN